MRSRYRWRSTLTVSHRRIPTFIFRQVVRGSSRYSAAVVRRGRTGASIRSTLTNPRASSLTERLRTFRRAARRVTSVMADKVARRWLTTAGKRAQPLYFGDGDDTLFGWYHPPASRPRTAGVVICAPFGVEAIFSHRALRHIAERLARDGFPVLR